MRLLLLFCVLPLIFGEPELGSAYVDSGDTDPLDCCEMTQFIQPSWRSECEFELSWKGNERLVIANNTPELTTQAPVVTTRPKVVRKDLMFLPQSCSQETCVFKKLGVIDDSGRVNSAAYWTLLNNYTEAHPRWKNPTDRVISKCLNGMGRDYEADCEINKLLACTVDVLTENCPYKRKTHDCRLNILKSGCVISSSKKRSKNRREACLFPPLVNLDVLSECGLVTLFKVESVVLPEQIRKKHGWTVPKYSCIDQFPSTTCLMKKMGILNKYKFMNYFGMKNRIRQFTSAQQEWVALRDIYYSSMVNIPMYGQHCTSQKKLLNLIDAMLMSCPVSKRSSSPQCTKFFTDIQNTPRDRQTVMKRDPDIPMAHYRQNIPHYPPFLPTNSSIINNDRTLSLKLPKVKFINIKPVIITRLDKPLVLAPVYLLPQQGTISQRDNLYRRTNYPYWLHERILQAHSTTPVPDMSTVSK